MTKPSSVKFSQKIFLFIPLVHKHACYNRNTKAVNYDFCGGTRLNCCFLSDVHFVVSLLSLQVPEAVIPRGHFLYCSGLIYCL